MRCSPASSIMSHQLICSCLQLSPDHWPPDHYTLLGLDPREVESSRIERRVQERMERLRRYQLTHAEQVTEGMNRLAQALVCLTDPVARAAYDAKLFPRRAKQPTVTADSRRPLAIPPRAYEGEARVVTNPTDEGSGQDRAHSRA